MSRKHARLASLASLPLAAAASLAFATPAQAATGGAGTSNTPSTNPGVVSLTDAAGNHVCTGVLVAPTWVLTADVKMRCSNAVMVTGDSHDHVQVVDKHYQFPASGWDGGNDPVKSQTVLMELDQPVQRVKPAHLSKEHPKAGEKLDIVAFNGPEGINRPLSIGRANLPVQGHNAWLSWFGQPKGMTLDNTDSGAPIMRGKDVVAITNTVSPHVGTSDAEDIANVYDWTYKTIKAHS